MTHSMTEQRERLQRGEDTGRIKEGRSLRNGKKKIHVRCRNKNSITGITGITPRYHEFEIYPPPLGDKKLVVGNRSMELFPIARAPENIFPSRKEVTRNGEKYPDKRNNKEKDDRLHESIGNVQNPV